MSVSFTRRREYIVATLEILLFLLTTGLLAYLSQTLQWKQFTVVLIVSLAVLIGLTVLRVGPLHALLKRLEEREFRFATRLGAFGVEDLYNMQVAAEQSERNVATQEAIQKAGAMYLLANSAASYVDPSIWRHWPTVRERLDAGVTMNILVLDPFSADKQVRDQLNTAGESPDAKFKFPTFYELYNKYPNVNIRFVSTNVYCTLFFTEDTMFYDPYHLGRFHDRIERFFCLQIANREVGKSEISYYALLRRHFDVLWTLSVDFEDFVDQNAALVENLVPKSLRLTRRHRPAVASAT